MAIVTYKDFPDLHALFDVTPLDRRYASMLRYAELADMSRLLGQPVAYPRPLELELVSRVRRLLDDVRFEPEVPLLPCSGCQLEGLRWKKLDDGTGELTYRLDRGSLDSLYAGRGSASPSNVFIEEMQRLDSMYRRLSIREARDGEVPDFTVRAEPYDGPRNTLGVTIYYVSGDNDLDVGKDQFVSVQIVFDTQEFWTANFFRTVGIHEFLHCLGLDHAPVGLDDIMDARFRRARTDYGAWTLSELDSRFVGFPLLPA